MLLRDRLASFGGVGNKNAENFSLSHFFDSNHSSLDERVQSLSRYYRDAVAEGTALYCRKIVGAIQNRTRVRDERTGEVREMVMLGSNNYLGLTTHPHIISSMIHSIQEFGSGVAGPPLLNGMSEMHRTLERKLATLKGGSSDEWDALLFSSGYQANLGWVRGLMRKGDVLIYDELSHASLFDGISLVGDEIKAIRFRHNQTDHLERLLKRYSKSVQGQIFVCVEGVYSMDGDVAPLPIIQKICHEYQAVLVVDDAHGTGVLGESGAGTAEYFGLHGKIDLSLGTFSKSLGVTGGFIVARREVVDYLRFFARSYMFSAHLSIATVAAVLAGFEVMENEPERLVRLHQNAQYLARGLREQGYQARGESPIIPVHIPPTQDIRQLNRRIHESGVFLNSIEYPAVALDEQRLRVSVMATHTKEDLDFALEVFDRLRGEFSVCA